MANQVEHTIEQNNASIKGLTSEEVRAAQAAGKVNADATVKTRSYGSIFRSNICTLFNLINLILAVFVFLTGSYKNMLFMLVIVINTIIGIVQEIRSKITTDRLSIVVAANVEVMRDGRLQKIPIDELVLGDVMRLGRGNQIPTDSVVLEGECKTDESLLTGESQASFPNMQATNCIADRSSMRAPYGRALRRWEPTTTRRRSQTRLSRKRRSIPKS